MSLLLFALGCAKKTPDPGTTPTPVDRGPTTIEVDGDPNGLWWSDGSLTLADDDNNRILTWTDADGIGLLGDLPRAPAEGAGLGQPVRTADGTVVVTRFGYGTAGDVVTLAADGTGGKVPGLDVERRRLGLALAPDGTLFDTWFLSNDAGRSGAVSRLSLAGGEQDVVTDLGKPVGVLVQGDHLLVSDQDAGELLSAPLDDLSHLTLMAQLDAPDLLCAGPDGTVFTGGAEGDVRRIGADGSVDVFASGFQEVRGVAYDGVNRRLFLVDHDGDDADGTTNFLQILPVDE